MSTNASIASVIVFTVYDLWRSEYCRRNDAGETVLLFALPLNKYFATKFFFRMKYKSLQLIWQIFILDGGVFAINLVFNCLLFLITIKINSNVIMRDCILHYARLKPLLRWNWALCSFVTIKQCNYNHAPTYL